MVEVTLRDCRNIEVILAMDRLALLPRSVADMQTAMSDMQTVRDFATERVPQGLRDAAKNLFIEHAGALREHLVALQSNGKE
ncbi:hypothetical protein CEE58_15665 [Stenotrophomonas maltophilia]|nr:hypothetical protein CEE58_15665 [Stenotrophomonas maltophilia]RRU72140.1 hypothetical protein EGJ89_10025 [Stenotrophomonas maltophilia]